MTEPVVASDIPRPAAAAPRTRWTALIALCAGFLMIVLDTTIVSVAQASIQQELDFSQAGLAWLVNGYLIAFGGLLLLAGRVGDLLGRKRVFLGGLWLFLLASLLCGLARSQETLIAARFVQGVGGAFASSVILGMIVALFPTARERGRAIAIYAFVGSAGASLGLVAGGLLVDALSWHWIFFVNLPIGLVTIAVAARVLERDEPLGLRAGADVPGALLIVAAQMLGIYAIVAAGEHGFGTARTLLLGPLALALLGLFLLRETRAAHPLMPLRLLRVPDLAAANLVQALAIAGMFGMQFMLALQLQLVLGLSPLQVGFAMVPIALAIGATSLGFTARLMARIGPKATALPGLLLIAAGLLWLQRAPADGSYWLDVFPALLPLGIGGGLLMPALSTLAMANAPTADAGLASGLANTTQQIGGAIGLAVLATASASRSDALRDGGASAAEALAGGIGLAFAISAALALVAGAVALPLLSGRPRVGRRRAATAAARGAASPRT
ncbi:MFS transporter [Conexibacter arvalis]|uniref:EmrB/QacA subfamily drug resistance transporter n=1 Tax=Conexibacter arvalis TaxID=912552 RepID=A0A840IHX3_9ACTN|nr:MFS transporter [Conexibacter arvalis]MBB4663773.1 EmrB/QacA subfamily drug resistance transporter [Conexibacter arvalis]